MSDQAFREMTIEEWSERIVGKSKGEIAVALSAAEQRGRRTGQRHLRSAVYHYEVAYRYARNASDLGANKADLLESAATFAQMGHEDLIKAEDI